MPKLCVDFSELVNHAVTMGYGYNKANTFLTNEVCSDEEAGYYSYDLDYLKSDEHTIGKDALKVMLDFMEVNKLEYLEIV